MSVVNHDPYDVHNKAAAVSNKRGIAALLRERCKGVSWPIGLKANHSGVPAGGLPRLVEDSKQISSLVGQFSHLYDSRELIRSVTAAYICLRSRIAIGRPLL